MKVGRDADRRGLSKSQTSAVLRDKYLLSIRERRHVVRIPLVRPKQRVAAKKTLSGFPEQGFTRKLTHHCEDPRRKFWKPEFQISNIQKSS